MKLKKFSIGIYYFSFHSTFFGMKRDFLKLRKIQMKL